MAQEYTKLEGLARPRVPNGGQSNLIKHNVHVTNKDRL